MLLNNKKFDMRIHVLIKSYEPLSIFVYDEGFFRSCQEEYDINDLTLQSHITNIGYQIKSEDITWDVVSQSLSAFKIKLKAKGIEF